MTSVTQYVRRSTTSSAQTIYALRMLRIHGLMQQVYRFTVVPRLTYAASAWRGLTKTSDRQRINSISDRPHATRIYCLKKLSGSQITCCTHCCHSLRRKCYNLRQSGHSLQLPKQSTHLSDWKFFTRVACYTETHIRLIIQWDQFAFSRSFKL